MRMNCSFGAKAESVAFLELVVFWFFFLGLIKLRVLVSELLEHPQRLECFNHLVFLTDGLRPLSDFGHFSRLHRVQANVLLFLPEVGLGRGERVVLTVLESVPGQR